MALKNPKIFGLNVRTLLADVENKNTAIQNLGINPLDLEIIKGSTNAGMSRFDWISFSRLKNPLFRTLDRFSNESTTFNGILLNRAGTDQTLFGNLDISGSLSGTAIRYRYRDFDVGVTVGNFSNPSYKIADISTSRVSAWSSSDSRANNPNSDTQKLARISYGARVGIVKDGKLEFGPQSTATQALGNESDATTPQRDSAGNIIPGPAGQPRLQTSIVPEVKEFPSEVPTSIIKCKIGNEIVKLYAMKGIPLVFKGFFRSLNATATVDVSGTKKRASWKIVETANENSFTNYPNHQAGTSTISYRSPISRERFIKLYKNPNEIFSVDIRSANLRELPATQLPECTRLEFSYNQLKIFPNFNFIAPNLNTLLIRRNPFYLSDIETERTFNSSVLAKIPANLNNLHMEGTFYGSIERNIISARLPDLVTFDCGRGGGAYFHQDTRNNSATVPTEVMINGGSPTPGSDKGNASFCPDVPKDVTTYTITSNDFRSVDDNAIPATTPPTKVKDSNGNDIPYPNGSFSYKKLPNLVNLNVNSNYYLSDGNHSLASADSGTISTINYSSTAVAIPNNLGGKSSLTKFVSTYNRGSKNPKLVDETSANYLFGGCGSLTTINLYATNLGAINFPLTFSNPSLTYLDLRYTRIRGGKPQTAPADQEHVIYAETFKDATELEYILIDSGNLGAGFSSEKNTIDPDAFLYNSKLYYFWYRSNTTTGTTGDISQLFNANPRLTYIWMQQNRFTGTVPNFVSNPSIYYVNLQNNQLSGSIPGFKSLNNLRFLYLQNNNLTGMLEPDLLPNLRTYQAPNNQIAGQIPDFTGCPRLRSLTLRNNQIESYKVGAFAKLYQINFIDLKFNKLTQSDLDQILIDLHSNWKDIKRGGVSINLKNQTNDNNAVGTFTSNGSADSSRTPGTYNITDAAGNLSGTDAKFKVVVASDGTPTITHVSGSGIGYAVNETITINDSSLGGGGGANIILTVTTVASGLTFPTEAGYEKARILDANGWSIGLSGGIPDEQV